jgi:hypothetical protein
MIADHAPYTALLPYHSFDPEGAVFVQTDGSIGVAWEVGALPCDAATENDLGSVAARLEGVLKLLPEGCAAQAILVASRDVGERLGSWASATTAGEGSILLELTNSRVRATQKMSLSFQGAPFVAKSFRRYFTIRLFPKWASIGIAGLLGSGDLETRLREGYAKAKKELLDLALAVENGLLQTGIGSRRLSEDTLAGLAFRMLHPGLNPNGKPLPARPDHLIRDRLAVSPLSADFASGTVTGGTSNTKVLSAIDLPMLTWAGMLSLGLPSVLDYLPECVLVFNIEVPSQEEVKRLLGRKKRLAFCQLSSGDVKVDMAAMKSEVDQALGEMFLGSRVLSARMHLILSDPSVDAIEVRARSVVGVLAQAGLAMVEEKGLAFSLLLQSLPLSYSPENDRWLRRGRKMMGVNLAHLMPVYGSFQAPVAGSPLLNRGRHILILRLERRPPRDRLRSIGKRQERLREQSDPVGPAPLTGLCPDRDPTGALQAWVRLRRVSPGPAAIGQPLRVAALRHEIAREKLLPPGPRRRNGDPRQGRPETPGPEPRRGGHPSCLPEEARPGSLREGHSGFPRIHGREGA